MTTLLCANAHLMNKFLIEVTLSQTKASHITIAISKYVDTAFCNVYFEVNVKSALRPVPRSHVEVLIFFCELHSIYKLFLLTLTTNSNDFKSYNKVVAILKKQMAVDGRL